MEAKHLLQRLEPKHSIKVIYLDSRYNLVIGYILITAEGLTTAKLPKYQVSSRPSGLKFSRDFESPAELLNVMLQKLQSRQSNRNLQGQDPGIGIP